MSGTLFGGSGSLPGVSTCGPGGPGTITGGGGIGAGAELWAELWAEAAHPPATAKIRQIPANARLIASSLQRGDRLQRTISRSASAGWRRSTLSAVHHHNALARVFGRRKRQCGLWRARFDAGAGDLQVEDRRLQGAARAFAMARAL
jgi:hypothetical protein